jgi:hypothetical protein
MTTEAPSSAWRTAINAEASRTDAGPVSATAALANSRLAALSRCFRPTVNYQLIDQAAIWCDVGEKPPHPLRRGAPSFGLGFSEPGHVGHAWMVSADQDLANIAAKVGGSVLVEWLPTTSTVVTSPENQRDFLRRGLLPPPQHPLDHLDPR